LSAADVDPGLRRVPDATSSHPPSLRRGFDVAVDPAAQRFMVIRRVVVVVAALAWGPGCFVLDRADALADGSVAFDVVDVAGRPVPGARVTVDGAPRVATADVDGHVVLRGLVPGDHVVRVGVFDRATGGPSRGAVVDAASIRTAEISRGAFATPRLAPTAQLLPPVTVVDTAALGGRVEGCGPALCRVVVVRRLALGSDERRDVVGSVEATTVVDADGNWSVDGIVPGAVVVVAFASDPVDDTPARQSAAASRPASFAVADVALGAGGADVPALTLAPLPGSTTLVLELAGAFDEAARIAGALTLLAPATNLEAVDVALPVDGLDGLARPILTLDTAAGVFDLDVVLENGAAGRLRGAVVVPGLGPQATLAVSLDAVPCIDDDCDGDGLVSGDDDDDDGDGQVDAAETAPCRGPGRGTDLDGDCLCEPADPVPDCATNVPGACTPTAAIVCPDDAST
jgi:hypothetical protein